MNNEYRIALFGPKNSGKTVYLTTVYSHGGNANDSVSAHVMASDDSSDGTHDYLTNSYQRLCNGEWPDATAFAQLRAIRFVITSEGVQSRVNIPDVCGEITARGRSVENWTQPEHDLKTQILSEFSTFDGFLIFAPADNTVDGKYLEFKWEVDALLKALKERAAADGIVRRPVAVVVSKWDVAVKENSSPDDECKNAATFFRTMYSETASALDETFENWKVFPVSSTGPTTGGRPPEKIQPYGVAAPLLWLVRSADESSLQRAEAFYSRHEGELFRKSNKYSGSTFVQDLVSRYQTILAKSPPRSVQERARVKLAELRRVIWKRRLKHTTLVVSAVLFAVASGFTAWDYTGYQQALQTLEKAPEAFEPLEHALAGARSYADHPLGFSAGALGWKTELLAMADAREFAWESAWVERLQQPIATVTDKSMQERIGDCERFLQRFPQSRSRSSVEGMRHETELSLNTARGTVEAERLLSLDQESFDMEQLELWVENARTFLENNDFQTAKDRHQVVSAFVRRETELADRRAEKGWKEFNETYARLADRPFEQYLAASRWLAQNLESPHADEASVKIAEALAAADDKLWNQVQEFKQSYPTDFQKILEKTNDYLTKTEFKRHRVDAAQFRIEQINHWDKQLYKDIQDEVIRSELTDKRLEMINHRCSKYVEATDRSVAMRKHVEDWLKWYDGLQDGVTASVELESVTIKRGARWHSTAYYPDVFVEVKVGSRSGKSEEKELDIDVETSGFPGRQLGIFLWKLGDRDLNVAITCTDFSTETLPAKLIQDNFMLRHLNGIVSFDDGKILVKLKCEAAVPPTFPSYVGVK